MKLKRTLSILLLCAMVLCMTGCKKIMGPKPTETTVPPTTEAVQLTAQEQYAAARAAVDSASDLSLRITMEKSTTVGGEIFLEKSEQILSMTGRGTAGMKILLGESVNYNNVYGAIYQETYADGMLYVLADGAHRLAGNVDAQTYMKGLVPAVLLDASLYGIVEYTEDGSIRFSQPVAAESWAMPEGAAFGNASGTAVVNSDGTLAETSYTVTYDHGNSQVSRTITAAITLNSAEIMVPGDAAKYAKVQSIEAIRMSKQALGFMKQAKVIHSAANESISSMATGMMRTQNSMMELNQSGDLMAKVGTNVMLGSYMTGQSQTFVQEETFANGMYTVSANGGEPTQKTEVTADVIAQYCNTAFETHLVGVEFWSNAAVQELDDQYLITLSFNEGQTAKLRKYISQTMFSDENALDLLAPNSNTVEISGTFAVDKVTGLPLTASYRYAATDVMEEQEYMLLLEAGQTYQIAGISGLIQENAPAETAPAETVATEAAAETTEATVAAEETTAATEAAA